MNTKATMASTPKRRRAAKRTATKPADTPAAKSKPGGKAKPVGSDERAHEITYLRQRIASLEALVEENLALTARIAELEAELATGRVGNQPAGTDAAVSAAAPTDGHVGPASLFSRVEAGWKELSVQPGARAEAARAESARPALTMVSQSLLAAKARRPAWPGERASILLVGDRRYFGGGGPSFAHLEIRDILYGLPDDMAVTFLRLHPNPGMFQETPHSSLRDDIEVIDVVLPEGPEAAEMVVALAPDLIMNIGPLKPVAELFAHLPSPGAGVLNLLHGEAAGLGAWELVDSLRGMGGALVTTAFEQGCLGAIDFAGEIVRYVRGVNIAKMQLTGLEGAAGIICIAEDVDERSLGLADAVAEDLRGDGVSLMVMGTPDRATAVRRAEFIEPQEEGDLFQCIATANAVLVPPGTVGMPQALQVALAMGKVCLLPDDPFARAEFAEVPGLRYPAEPDALSRQIRAFLADPLSSATLVSESAEYGRKNLRRSTWAKMLSAFLARRLAAVRS